MGHSMQVCCSFLLNTSSDRKLCVPHGCTFHSGIIVTNRALLLHSHCNCPFIQLVPDQPKRQGYVEQVIFPLPHDTISQYSRNFHIYLHDS